VEAFETFAKLDSLGRCGVTYANVCIELMPVEDRGDISAVYPSGWDNNPYDFVDGKYLYNRCHLIGFQLTGENANERNLITGTRYMNVQGMLPFENMVADHVKEEAHHVLYRVTPIFEGSELVARGVQMEALCVECAKTVDTDDDFFFHVYCYNVQPGVEIDYATGENWEARKEYTGEVHHYVINTSSRKFHTAECSNAIDMNEKNRADLNCTRDEMIDKGYEPAGCCAP
jgi:DNA-entry nuclease